MQITHKESHAKRVCKVFEIKSRDLYVQSDTFLLAKVFENFRNMCLEYMKSTLLVFFTVPGLAWHRVLEKTKLKLDLITNIDMLLMIKKVSKVRYAMLFIDMQMLATNA